MTRTWKCLKCAFTANVSYEDLLETGTPMCCDEEMELMPVKPMRVVVEISGGCLVNVYAEIESPTDIQVIVLDWDVDDEEAVADNKSLEKEAQSMKVVG